MLAKIEKRFCDLCWSENQKAVEAVSEYSTPSLPGMTFDGCKKHADQMRDVGGYTFKRVKQPAITI